MSNFIDPFVWVVIDETGICGIFSSEEKAQDYINKYAVQLAEIHAIEVDKEY